jgi:ribosomal protein L37AE/L43A
LRETDHNRGKQDRPHFIRKSKRDTFEVLGKETDMYKCRDCNKLYNDHCKKTGKHRGWLCHSCNTGAGHFGDDHEGITRIANYLKERAFR